jgi:F0F1-type ATP synthase assembly protein I
MNAPVPEHRKNTEENGPRGESWYVLAARYSHLAFVLPCAVFVGWLIGAGLDHWLHTRWIVIPGVIFGMVVGMMEIIRVATRGERK